MSDESAAPVVKEVSVLPARCLAGSECLAGSSAPVGPTSTSNAPGDVPSGVAGPVGSRSVSSVSMEAAGCPNATPGTSPQSTQAIGSRGDRQDTAHPAFPSAPSGLSVPSHPLSSALPSSSLSLEPALHGVGCGRGELLLTEPEARSVEYHVKQTLSSKDNEAENRGDVSQPHTRWRLRPVLPELLRPASRKLKRASGSTTSRRGANALTELLESAGIKLEPNELAATGRPQRVSRSCSSSVGNANATSAESTSSSHSPVSSEKQNHGESGVSSCIRSPPPSHAPQPSHWVPPPWVCHMHRVLVELCKQSVCLPFFPRVSPGDAHYPELARKVYPAVPITLETVLDRLERNEYSRCEEVFNDVHTVFLCAFRYYEPGNQYWMMAHEASLVFHNLTHNKPLLSADFDACSAGAQQQKSSPDNSNASSSDLSQWGGGPRGATGSGLGSASSSAVGGEGGRDNFSRAGAGGRSERRSARRSRRTDGGMKPGKGRKSKARGEAIGATALSPADAGAGLYHPGALPTTAPLPSAGGSTPMLSGSSVASASAAAGVTSQEREAFQQLLGQLDMEVHLELYSVFRDRALWLSFDTGEVELDDANTAPEVFRWERGGERFCVPVLTSPGLKKMTCSDQKSLVFFPREMVSWCQARLIEQQRRGHAAAGVPLSPPGTVSGQASTQPPSPSLPSKDSTTVPGASLPGIPPSPLPAQSNSRGAPSMPAATKRPAGLTAQPVEYLPPSSEEKPRGSCNNTADSASSDSSDDGSEDY